MTVHPPRPALADPMHVVVAGGGPAALEGALALQRLAARRVAITLLAPETEFVYRPLAVVEPFGLAEVPRIPLAEVAAERGWTWVQDAVVAVDADRRRVRGQGGREIGYDAVLLAIGAKAADAVPGAMTFGGPQDGRRLAHALHDVPRNRPTRVAYVAAPATAWTLPLYELALLTTRWAAVHAPLLEVWAVTHEPQPLDVFGPEAAEAVAARLEAGGVRVWRGVEAELVEDGRLWGAMEGGMPVDLAVALPRPVGRRIAGVPHDAEGFVPVDEHGRVPSLSGVYAAGDMTTRPLKQGGLATEQADAAAATIAAAAGADVDAAAYQPVLHAKLLTGEDPVWFLRGTDRRTIVDDEAPWWPPHKIHGRYLSPYLAARATGTARGVGRR